MPTRHHLGLRWRSALAWAGGGLVLSVVLSFAAYQLVRAQLVEDRERRTTDQAYTNARAVRSALRADEPDLNAVLNSLGGNTDSNTMTWVQGRWFAGSVGAGPSTLPVAVQALVAEGDAGTQIAEIDGVPHVVVGVPLGEVGARYFELVSLEDVSTSLDRLAGGLAVAATLTTIGAAVAGWYVSRQVLRPARTMATAAERIANGDLSVRLDAFGDPELEPIQRSFNHMADTVQERLDRERRFAFDVSHELRTPLTALLAFVQVARRRMGDSVAVEKALTDLEERGERFRSLVLDLVEISRMDAGVADVVPETIDAVELVRAVAVATGHDSLEIRCPDGARAVVKGDKRRLGQAVQNLLENADRYGKGATAIVVDAAAGSVVIHVDDRGPGVDPHERTHIFARFARGRAGASVSEGSGLGLALVAEHVRLHGGQVLVSDGPDGGARFSIVLPASEPTEVDR
jgi:two-component system sensor histidine kinase MtrB